MSTLPGARAQQLVVEVQGGPLACHKVVLEPGHAVRVGRGEAAGLRLAHDTHIAEEHLELSWDGVACRLRALTGEVGTLLEGQAVREAALSNGAWVRAGQSDLWVHMEGATPPTPEEPVLEEAAALQSQALEALRQVPEPLFAVLDAARDRRIRVLLHESVEAYRSLYEGLQGEALAEVAPFLVELPAGSRLLEALVQEGWGRSWGIYLACRLPLLELRRHLRKFLMVEAEGMEGRLYFRFYDPRVLCIFLPTCVASQRQEFFGPLARILCEGPDSAVLQHAAAAIMHAHAGVCKITH